MKKQVPAFVAGEIDQVLIKNSEYRDYIQTHVSNVEDAFMRYFVPLLNRENLSELLTDKEIYDAIIKARKNIQVHDASKYDEIEFDAYRYKFYPTDEEQADPDYKSTVEARFRVGWEHHYANNKHHPDHWASEQLKPFQDMPIEYIIEMICDWLAMGVYFGTSTIEWFENEAERERECMTENTEQLVKEFLYVICPTVEEIS